MVDIFTEPAKPFTLFSYSDFAMLVIFNILLYLFLRWKMIILNKKLKIAFILLFFLVFPFISNKIEINNVYKKFKIVDGFNLLYTLLKIPIWWLIGILNYYAIKKIKI